ncbi:hypothetical protein MHYP_G00250270 [Metynnis hypsauchen]
MRSAGVLFSRISGAEVEMRVRPGDNVTLYSDCVWKTGFLIVWFRNCSHDHQPPLIMSATQTERHHAAIYNDLMQNPLPRYFFKWNSSSGTHDLLVKNVSESDLGLYYCALQEKKITEDQTGRGAQKDVFQYGNRTTRLSLLGVLFSRISGAEVEMRVRPGDDISLYCDCVWKSGFIIVWFRNCSHDHQPPLMISATTQSHHARIYDDLMQNPLPRYFLMWNSSSQAHDLLVEKVSESDLGLYYCALQERKVTEDQTGRGAQKAVFQYGNRTTRLSLLDNTSSFPYINFMAINIKRVIINGEKHFTISAEERSQPQ